MARRGAGRGRSRLREVEGTALSCPRPRGRLPPAYPAELAGEVTLRDGRTAQIRPVLPSDSSILAKAIERADPETIRMRFLGSRPSMDEASLRHLVEVDYTWRLALVAVSGEGRGIAIGRYEGAPGERSAEVAVAVEPGWRRVGLGTGLLVLLAFAAAARGIRAFLATYSGENYEVSRMVARSGLPHRTTVSRGVTEAEIDLTELAVDDPFGTLRNLLGRGTAG